MNNYNIIVVILFSIICMFVGHIVGYCSRKREEVPKRISVIVASKEFADLCKSDAGNILAFYYGGDIAPNIEFRVIDKETKNNYIKNS